MLQLLQSTRSAVLNTVTNHIYRKVRTMSQTAMAAALIAVGVLPVQATPSTGVKSPVEIRGFNTRLMTACLLKFTIRADSGLLPTACRLQDDREAQRLLEYRYAQDALDMGLLEEAEFERLRSGHYDTGEAMVVNPTAQKPGASVALRNVSVDAIRRALVAAGYRFVDLSYYPHPIPSKDRKKTFPGYVIQLDYARVNRPEDPEETVALNEAVASLLNGTTWTVHSYANPDGKYTINCGQRSRSRTEYVLRLTDGIMTAEAV